MHNPKTISDGPVGLGPNPNVHVNFLEQPSNPDYNHELYYNHECWALGAQDPTLMYTHECFYNDPVTLITTMHFTTTTSAGPLGTRAQP